MTTEETTYNREVTIYEHGNYQGRSQKLRTGKYNIDNLTIGNDCLSSLIVPEGMKVTLFEHANFAGKSKTFLENCAFVGDDFNDKASSMTVDIVVNYAKWMEHNLNKIKDKSLKQLCFPGTHDSGTYNLEKELAPDANDTIRKCWEFRLKGTTGIDDYIKGQAICQDKTIYEQLQSGIRYIDLRVCCINDVFYTCHSLRGDPIKILVNDIKRFLDENQKEIVIIKQGFKNMTKKEEENAKNLFKELLGKYYTEGFPAESTFEQQIKSGQRAIFTKDNWKTNYKQEATTNDKILEELLKFKNDSRVLEAQFNRPITDQDYALGYVQRYGLKLLKFLPLLLAVPVFGIALTAYGATTVSGFILYLRKCSPVPTDLRINARDSRSIIREYFFKCAKDLSIQRPTVTTCDFFEEVPIVDIAINLSTDQRFDDLLESIHDVHPICSADRFLSDCPASEIATALKSAGYNAYDTAKFMKENIPGVTAEVLAAALKNAGYGLNEITTVLKELYGFGAEALKKVLEGAGYAGEEIGNFFKNMGGEFADLFKKISTPNIPKPSLKKPPWKW